SSSAISLVLPASALEVQSALASDRQRTSELPLGGRQSGRALELARGVLKTQSEEVLADGCDVGDELLVTHVSNLLRLGHLASPHALRIWSLQEACVRPSAAPRGRAALEPRPA